MTRSAEELRIDKRPGTAGDVRVSKHIETDHVKKTVPVETEEVIVERRPVERGQSAAELRDGEIVVPVVEEEVTVEKRPVVKEEVVIKKQAATRNRTVEADACRSRHAC